MTALITGASSGIGFELARICAARGHDLVLVARREGTLLDLARTLAKEHGIRAEAIAADLAHPHVAAAVADRTATLGIDVDILVNNAGFGLYGPFAETSLDAEVEMIQLNITSLTELTKLLVPGMLERRAGRILNVASTASFFPGPLMAVYYATKAYVLSFSEAISNELEGTGVTVTALCPGPTVSGFQAAANLEASKLVAGKTLPSSAEVAAFGYDAMMKGTPVAVHGFANKLLVQTPRFSPRAAVRKAVRSFQDKRHD